MTRGWPAVASVAALALAGCVSQQDSHDATSRVGGGGSAAIAIEMATNPVAEPTVTGGNAEQSIPEVRSWTPRTVQRGRLVRQ